MNTHTYVTNLALSKTALMVKSNTVGPLYPQVPHLWIQPGVDRKYLGEKIPESSKKQNFNLPRLLHTDNYLYSIYIVFTTIY